MTMCCAPHAFERDRSLPGDFDPRCDRSEIIAIFRRMFRRLGCDETIPAKMKPFSAFGASRKKPRMVITATTTTAEPPATEPGDKSMRALSFILALGFVLVGSSFAGAPDGNLPGVGTFQYSGSPVTTTTTQPIVVAARF